MSDYSFYSNFLKDRDAQSLGRSLPFSDGQVSYRLCFSSNDYLGYSTRQDLWDLVKSRMDGEAFGSTGSRLLSGDSMLFQELESKLASFLGVESALVFNSGYQANVGVVSSLVGKGDLILADKLIHASLIDGAQLSGAKLLRYSHLDLNHLERLLKERRSDFNRVLIVTESVFSMDGNVADLEGLVALKRRYESLLLVDECHSFGVYGDHGEGMVASKGLHRDVDVIVGTFGKALGGYGAFVGCAEVLKRYFVTCSRSFLFSTALPSVVVLWGIVALEACAKDNSLRGKLWDNVDHFREKLGDLGLDVLGSSAIVPVVLGASSKALEWAATLQAQGIDVRAIRTPTVAEGAARLRFTLSALHSRDVLDECLGVLHRLM